jgi:uncharacterized radical SAM protein YgiQ
MQSARDIFSYRQYWANRFVPAPVLPMSRAEMDALGWDCCDVIIVTGDAYVDHPGFGMALIGRLLEAQGFRVGIIAQPDWRGPDDFRRLGKPTIMFGVTSGNMDSMLNHYTADRRIRSNDAYSPNDLPGKRPDRAVIAYTARCRQAYADVPVIIGGIEASLRRAAHYDYWSDAVRRSVLLDAKADLLLYGNAERAVVEVAHRLAAGARIGSITDLRGTVFARKAGDLPADELRLPSFEEVSRDPQAFCRAERLLHLHNRPEDAQTLVQGCADRDVCIRPVPVSLTTEELDALYELPYTRSPHPGYAGARIPAFEPTRFSIVIHRGCYGGCSFCSLGCHQGPVIQSRSEDSIVREVECIRNQTAGFPGVISDLGGPSANMYRTRCLRPAGSAPCPRSSCLYPSICAKLETSHEHLIKLYRRIRELPGVKKALIGSGIRLDLALRSPAYIRELTRHHVGGYLKIAPEHICPGPLAYMQKPGREVYERFMAEFACQSREAGKQQYLIPYFIAAHPGTSDGDMVELALWLKHSGIHVDQVQTFIPSPMTMAAAMYHTGFNPLREPFEKVEWVPRDLTTRRLHKALLRYHDANNWPMLRKALTRMGREECIGNAKRHLVPLWQPAGTGNRPEGVRHVRTKKQPESRSRPAMSADGKQRQAGKVYGSPHTGKNAPRSAHGRKSQHKY